MMGFRSCMLIMSVLQGAGMAQTVPSGVTGKLLATHHAMRLKGTHVIHGGSAEAAYAVMFQTDDLPEGKAMHAMIDLAKKPTDEQDEFISRYSTPKTMTVTCETVEVVEMFNSQNRKSAKLAHGKKCSLDSLE
ncbi:hypothetical protein [Edaphobacter modestus]|uniref:Uncharacterized protein n=1 Tax=Edaphobacter modestus TaxID=388466 RepID=A0A4Q7YE99_9BACT|nr:hypothetical protein [Edaphobacter modestus]RZU35692.1 hypothetical protein BDD14_5784 [Edaphobacter modestus]